MIQRLLIVLFAATLLACSQEDPEAMLQSAKALIEKGDSKGAAIELKNTLQIAPENAEARFLLGRIHLENGDFAAAEKELRHARQGGHDEEQVLPPLARALLGINEPQRVLDEVQTVPGGAPEGNAELEALRAQAQLMLRDPEAAEASLAQADSLSPEHPEALKTQAKLAIAKKDPETALRLVDQALAKDDRQVDLWLMKGDLLRLNKQMDAALAAYAQAQKIDPKNLPARLAATLVHLEAGANDQAETELAGAAKIAPANVMVRYLGALIDFRNKRYKEANNKLLEALKVAPNFLPAHLLSGAVNLVLGNREAAISGLKRVVDQAPEHSYARKLLAAAMLQGGELDQARSLLAGLEDSNDPLLQSLQGDIALRKGDYAEASRLLQSAVELAPDNVGLLTELAQSRMAGGDSAGAVDALNRAAELDTQTARPDVLLVITHLKAKRYAEAFKAVDRLAKDRPNDPITHNLRGTVHAAKGDTAQARANFAKALEADPAYLPAAANLARLDLQAKDPKSARGRFEAVLKKDPKQSRAWLALAALDARERDETAYLNDLTQAKRASPKDPQPHALLAGYWLAKRDAGKALAAAREGLDVSGRKDFYNLIGAAHSLQGDKDNALAAYVKWAEASPRSPVAQLRVAQAQLAKGNRGPAMASLDKALALDPDQPDAVLIKTGLLAEEGKTEEALVLAQGLQKRQDKSPVGYAAEAIARSHAKQYPEATGLFKRAAELSGQGTHAVQAYAAQAAAGDPQGGEAYLASWLTKHPSDLGVRHALAQAKINAKRLKEAAIQYEYVLKTKPDDLVALNNLAWIYGEFKDNRALGIAEQAYRLSPDTPATLDTLGWILVNRGDTNRGLDMLRKALAKQPDAAEIHWHLAYGLYKSGDKARARQELQRLLDSGLAFPQVEEARALLSTI